MSANLKERLGVTELTDRRAAVWRALLAEFVGTLLLNLFGCAACVRLQEDVPIDSGRLVLVSLTFALIIMAVVQAIGHVSGAHVNPAVTAGMLVTGRISLIKGVLYIVAQCLGSITGSAVLKALTPESAHEQGLGLTDVAPALSPVQGFGVEFFLGFVLVLVVFGVCDANKPTTQGIAPIVIGLTVGVGHLAMINLTGSSMNPARTLGSAVIENKWNNHWVYWLGPILGGVASALLYHHAFSAPSAEAPTEYTPVQLKRLDKSKDEDGMA